MSAFLLCFALFALIKLGQAKCQLLCATSSAGAMGFSLNACEVG